MVSFSGFMYIMLVLISCRFFINGNSWKKCTFDVFCDDKMVAVLKDSVDVPILYCSSLMILKFKFYFSSMNNSLEPALQCFYGYSLLSWCQNQAHIFMLFITKQSINAKSQWCLTWWQNGSRAERQCRCTYIVLLQSDDIYFDFF